MITRMDEAYPRLVAVTTGIATPLDGRIFTVGSSADCHLQLPGRGLPPFVAHLLYKDGAYVFQVLTAKTAVALNGSAPTAPRALRHGDRIRFGDDEYIFEERRNDCPRDGAEPAVSTPSISVSGTALYDLIGSVVALLRDQNDEVFTDLVAGISRLLRCDASRLVEENPESGERKTIARFPRQSGLDRFSSSAIDWAKNGPRTILMHDSEWNAGVDAARSLEKNLVGSVLCAPLRDGEAVLGYLYLDRLQGNSPFTEEDRSFCDALLPLFSEILSNFHARRRQRETIARLQERQLAGSPGILYESELMGKCLTLAAKVARTDSPILVLGETGTGKELMARFLHANSTRSEKPFKAINCGALPEQLIESELFGHEKGAFTGATCRKTGLFESAGGGTVFLDEIGEMPLHLQVKLLRVLQEGEFNRVGGTDTLLIDVRIVAATNKNLDTEVAEGKFRQDLYFRLNVLTVQLPPLRERGADIALLSDYFIKKYCQQFGLPVKNLSAAARDALVCHAWPGNVRELENVMQKAILMSQGTRIEREDISIRPPGTSVQATSSHRATLREAREGAEKESIENALCKTGGNVSSAARLLEIDRKWLIKKIQDFGITPERHKK